MSTIDESIISTADVRTFRAALRRLERNVAATLQSQASCCGVSVAQCHVLLELDAAAESDGSEPAAESISGELARAPRLGGLAQDSGSGGLAVGDLADRLALDISTLSRTVEQLVQAGLATRQADPLNRRRQLVRLTELGALRVQYIHTQCDQQYQQLLSGLPAAQRQLAVQLLPRLADIMSAQISELDCGGSSCC